MKISTVIYVDDVPEVLDFYLRAFGIGAAFVGRRRYGGRCAPLCHA
jgi:hypothetical protein